jgi:hypothetical protein
MFIESIDKAQTFHNNTKSFQLLSFFAALVFAVTLHPAKAHAQIIGQLKVTVPFQFYAGNAKLPAGKYILRMLDNADLQTMEISTPDGSTSALFEVENAESNTVPPKNELIFNKYGNRYFLAKIFDEGNPDGSKVPESQYEKRVSQATQEAQEHVPAYHQGQQGR